jgi:hypothetical protein
VLQGLSPYLLELRFAASLRTLFNKQALLARMAEALPDLTLSDLSACPTLVSSDVPDIGQHIDISTPFRDNLVLLWSDNPSSQPLSTDFLTRLNLVCRMPGLHHQPLQFVASFTTRLRELHLDFGSDQEAHVVPVAALPPHLTALFSVRALLQLDANLTGVPDTPRSTPRVEASRTGVAAAACSTSQGAVCNGLEQLQTLELTNCCLEGQTGTPNTFVGEGRLAGLLQRTPNLKRLAFRHLGRGFPLGSVQGAAGLRGCGQMLTHLDIWCNFLAAMDTDAEVEHVCEWVWSLRHLRQLHLATNAISGPLFAQVSCMTLLGVSCKILLQGSSCR